MTEPGPAPGQLRIDVVDQRLLTDDRAGLVVLVEPLYGVVAVAAALDAGWASAELARGLHELAPIPLVSFEQSPTPQAGTAPRCRVRSDDLRAAARAGALLGAPALARPLAARLAASGADRVTFVPVLAAGEVAADAWWACGVLVRVLLDELDARDAALSDAAGIAVTLAQGAEDPAAQLGAGARWRRHLERAGHADDLRIAAAVDSLAVVPELVREGDAFVARPWPFTPAAGPRGDRS